MGNADEGDRVTVKDINQLGEVHQRAAKAVNLINDNDIDSFGFDVSDQSLQGRAFERATGVAAIIVVVGYEPPAFCLLACNVGFTRFPLRIEAVEFLLKALLCGLARVDRAAELS